MLHHHNRNNTPNKFKFFIDHAIYVVGLIGPIMTIPQITNIWIDKNAAGVSAISWSAYILVAIFWVFYGIVHKEKRLITLWGLWSIMYIFVLLGLIIYR